MGPTKISYKNLILKDNNIRIPASGKQTIDPLRFFLMTGTSWRKSISKAEKSTLKSMVSGYRATEQSRHQRKRHQEIYILILIERTSLKKEFFSL